MTAPYVADQARMVIDAYPHEQEIVHRIIRRHRRLTEREFNRIFGADDLGCRANSLGYFALLKPDKPILGLSLGGPIGNWTAWLDLTQHMVLAGEVQAETGEDGLVVYSLPETA